MTRFARRWKWTLAASLFLVALIAFLIVRHAPLLSWVSVFAYLILCGFRAAKEPRPPRRVTHAEPPPWRPRGRSLPCPPQCHIQVEHRHDRERAWR